MRLQVEYTRDRSGALDQLEQRLDDPRPLLTNLAGVLRGGFDRQFASGAGWARLLARTIRRKRGPGILVESGRLRSSLTRRSAPGAVEDIRPNSDGGSVLVGTRNPAAGPLQRGARGMPPRNPARLDPRFPQQAGAAVAAHLLGRSGGALSGLGL